MAALALGPRAVLTPHLCPQPAVRLCIPGPCSQSPPGPGVPSASLSPQLDCLDEDVLPDVFSILPHFADLSTFMIQQVIKFAKEIPAFRWARWWGGHPPPQLNAIPQPNSVP